MSTWKLIRLNFGRSPVHFGELGIGMEECSERVRSDTLFSAWVSTYARLFKKKAVEQLLQPFPKYSNHGGNTASSIVPFRLSSTFVFKRERDRIIDYLPRSIELPRGYPIGNDLTFAKTFKKLNYLPLEVWQRWYQGSGFDKQDRSELELKEGDRPDKNGRLYRAVTFSYQDTFGGSQQPVPRVAIDRTTRATNFYHTGFIQYQWEFDPKDKQHINSLSGLYFLLNFPQANPDLEQKLEAVVIRK
jgi:CRISPR-associated protein Csm4